MFDHVNFDNRAILTVARILHKATKQYGTSEVRRLNRAFDILSGRVAAGPRAHHLQKTDFYVPGMPAKPWYDPKEIPEAAIFESSYECIKGELMHILREQRGRGFDEPPPVDKYIVKSGAWDLFWIKDGCKTFEDNWAMCPETKRLIHSLPRVGESATFSGLRPGSHIQLHTGVANLRLTLHLGLIVPEGCELRLGDEVRRWEEGKCLVFDDSFLHETMNNSSETRILLLVDIWHPDLTSLEISVLEEILHRLDPDRPAERLQAKVTNAPAS